MLCNTLCDLKKKSHSTPLLYCTHDTPDRSSRIEWKTDNVVARLLPATWSDIVGRAHRLLHGLVLYEMLREPEIDELDASYIARRLHQPVLQLKVTMHYSVSVHVSHLYNKQKYPHTNSYEGIASTGRIGDMKDNLQTRGVHNWCFKTGSGGPTHGTEHIGEHPFDFRFRGAVTRILRDEVEEFASGGKVHYHVYVSLVSREIKKWRTSHVRGYRNSTTMRFPSNQFLKYNFTTNQMYTLVHLPRLMCELNTIDDIQNNVV